MKVTAISDLHGNFIDIPETDLLLIGGDLVPLSIQNYEVASRKWFLDKFKKWTDSIPADKILFIAGNHDAYLYNQSADSEFDNVMKLYSKDSKTTYLEDELYEYKGLKIYGTPWCKQFGNWSFMESNEELREHFNKIPDNVDILLTHDAPFGTSDVLLQQCSWADGSHIGNFELREAIKAKKPKYNIHGHLHSTDHDEELLDNTKVYNVSIKDENYNIVYKPLVIEC